MNLNDLSASQILLLSKEDLIEALIQFAKEIEENKTIPNEWLTVEQTKKMLNIRSNTTLFKYKNEGKLSYAMPSPKILLFERKSVLEFLNNIKQNSF